MRINKLKNFAKENMENLESIINDINISNELDTKVLKNSETALIIIDMVNGFVKQGNLMSPRISRIIPNVVNVAKVCENRGFNILAFADSHTKDSIEFKDYTKHCLRGTWESEIIDELKDFYQIKIIEKNSTNGFIEEEFIKWIKENNSTSNFIVVGNCTDICVMQFVITLKSYFNKHNKDVNIFIPIDSIETFDSEFHNGDLMNMFGIYNMKLNGIKIVSNIK